MPAHSFHLVPAAYVLLLRECEDRQQVLLQLRQGTGYMDGYWACGVAGHVEEGESVLETAVREAREEVGVLLLSEDLVPLTTVHRSNDVGGVALEQRVDFFLAARRWQGEPQVLEPAKSAGLHWFDLDVLPGLVPPHERMVLEQVRQWLDGGPPLPAVTTFGFQEQQASRPSPTSSGKD